MNNQTRLDRDWTEPGNLEVFRNKEIVCSYEVRSLLKGSKCYHCVCIISNKPGSVKQIWNMCIYDNWSLVRNLCMLMYVHVNMLIFFPEEIIAQRLWILAYMQEMCLQHDKEDTCSLSCHFFKLSLLASSSSCLARLATSFWLALRNVS